jgi:hypothetical protein
LPTEPCLLISGPLKAIIIAKWAQKAQDNPTQSHRISKCFGSDGRQNFRTWDDFPQVPKHQERQTKGLLLHITFWKVHLNIDDHNPVEHTSSHIWRSSVSLPEVFLLKCGHLLTLHSSQSAGQLENSSLFPCPQ